MKYLTKSDFLIAKDCNKKMYYKKNNYTNHVFEDEFTTLLAEGGLLVEYVAEMLFENGQTVDYKSNEANIAMTKKLISENDNITLFGPMFRHKKAITKMDILVKKGDTFTLYDVHSSSFNGDKEVLLNKNGTVKADKKKLIEDIAFQIHLLGSNYPDMYLVPFLMVLDKTKKSKYPNLLNNFKFEKTKTDEEGFVKPIIEFTGLKKEIVTDNDLFIKVNVSEEISKVMTDVKQRIEKLSSFVTEKEILEPKVPLSKICKTCEFKEGKKECWKHMPKHENDIFDLYHNTTQKIDKENVLNNLINEKLTDLFDWPIDELKVGKITQRQKIQLDNTQLKKEWINKEMLNEINNFKYPLHFIDFETSRPVIPHNKGDRPYEQLAFQWSCHTLTAPGAELIHKEWISFEKGFPNFKFAEALMKQVKSKGSVFMWHHHEKTVLKDIIFQMEDREYDNDKLYDWLISLTTSDRMIDMNVMAKDHYFHPDMKGKTSIKKVLPAIWNNSKYLKNDYNINNFFKPEHLKFDDPYKILEDNEELRCKQFDKINVGTDAIVAYQQMMRDLYMGDHNNAKNIKKMLIEYCKLDTFAMYIIYIHWFNSLVTNRKEMIDNIEKNIKVTDFDDIGAKHVIVREKDLYKGLKIGNFNGLKNAELRAIILNESIDGNSLMFDFFHDNSSNTRTSKHIISEEIPSDLLYKVNSIITLDKFDSLNSEYHELREERKELQRLALIEKTLSPKSSDRLRELNDIIQKIIDDQDNI